MLQQYLWIIDHYNLLQVIILCYLHQLFIIYVSWNQALFKEEFDYGNLILIFIKYNMTDSQVKSSIKFYPQAIRKTNVYLVHKAIRDNGEQQYAKVFDQQTVTKSNLDEAIEFNIEVFNSEWENYYFKQNILQIISSHKNGESFVILTEPYQKRLDQFLKHSPKAEKEALQIFQHVLKAVYSIIMNGFWTRNLRAQHFVLVNKVWKLQTVVYDEMLDKSGNTNDFIRNPAYQPPEAYQRIDFTQQQLDQRIVWDLGSLFIHIVTGSPKLSADTILKKFENEPFSFQKLGAKIGEKLSKKLKQMLGLMCHYDMDKRIKINDLILSGFFSKEVAEHYKKNSQDKKQTIFIGSSGQVSKSMRIDPNAPKNIGNVDPEKQINYIRESKLKQEIAVSKIKQSEIVDDKQFKNRIKDVIQEQLNEDESIQIKLDSINSEEFKQTINLYKNYLDKCSILQIGGIKFQQMLKLFKDQKQGKQLVQITNFALKFVKTMELCHLARQINSNKSFFKIESRQWEAFHTSKQFKALKKIINYRKDSSLRDFYNFRAKITSSNNKFVKQKQNIDIFVTKSQPSQAYYTDIKQPYRRILKLSYDMVADHYTKNKTVQWARLGMYITYCLAIDKYYLPNQFKNNFKFYFNWSKKQPCNYVSTYDFQKYLNEAPRVDLVQNSRYIMEKFFEV